MQRRMDYAVEVNGDVLVAQCQYEPKTFGGLVFPTHRRNRFSEQRCASSAGDPRTRRFRAVMMWRRVVDDMAWMADPDGTADRSQTSITLDVT
jgi:hypothetical protein